MLRYNRKLGKVELDNGADKIPVVDRLKKASRGNSQAKFFQDSITYAYHMYKKGGVFSSEFPKARAAKVGKYYFEDKSIWTKFEHNQRFKEFREYYEALQYNPEERALLSTEAEIEDLILHLKDIKYFVDDVIDTVVKVPKYEGSDEMVSHKVKQKVKVNNSKEKEASLKAIAEIIKIRKLLKDTVKTKKVESEISKAKSLMDEGGLDE